MNNFLICKSLKLIGRRNFNNLRNLRPVKKGIVSPKAPIPSNIQLPEYVHSGVPTSFQNIMIYESEDIKKIRDAARLARKMLEFANSLVEPGITTDEIDKLTHDEIIKHGAYPSPLNYYGFEKSICTSVNEVVCHGIPDNRKIEEGDLVSIDVSLYLNGYHGDNCGTVPAGKADNDALKLIQKTKDSVELAIQTCKPGR